MLKLWSDEMLNDFISSQDVKEGSKETYHRALEQFFVWMKNESIERPVKKDILTYKEFLEKRGLSSSTISSYLVTVRKFFHWTEEMNYYKNIANRVKGAKRNKNFKKDPLRLGQIKKLLECIDRTDLKGKRDYALLNLLIRTGLRAIEITRANVEDIRQQGGVSVLWVQGKARDAKDEFVVLTEETLIPIEEYLKLRGKVEDKDPLFSSVSDRNRGRRLTTHSISRIVKDYLRKVGIGSKRLTAHSLRHTAITLALLAGNSLQEAQVLARHSSINTTLIYSHNINRIAQAPEKRIDAYLNKCLSDLG